MKKNIIIGILTVVSILTLIFGYKMHKIADEARVQEELAKIESLEARFQADSLRMILIHETELAQRNLVLATKVYNEAKEKVDSLNNNK